MGEQRRELHRRARAVDAAYRAGDFDALRVALGDPPGFPNCRQPTELACGEWPLEYAIYWSPLSLIATLLLRGADPNYPDHAGFPSLIATLSTGRDDRLQLLRLLIDSGAEIDRRGHNDWTPLHYAVALRDLPALGLLLDAGADPTVRTRIDDRTTPLEDAEAAGFEDAAALLRDALTARGGGAGR